MKHLVAGVKRVFGEGKNGHFDMANAVILVPIEPGKVGKAGQVEIQGHGFEVVEMELDETALSAFQAVKFPVELDLETDQRVYRGEFKTFVTGIKKGFPAARSA